jgi:pimeloyl-ACP methyl ester carboxylesterase
MSESSFVGPKDFVETVSGRKFECHWYPPSRHDAPTLVFLHEGIGSTAMWKRFPADLAAATGCGTLVYSRHGYGWSSGREAPFAVDYMHREALETLPELLDKRAIENPVLIGHSDGASIAIIHAGGSGRPVRAVVLEAPHVFVEDLTIASIEQAKAAFAETDLRHKLARYHKDPETSFFGWNDIWLHPEFRDWNIEEYLPGVTCPSLAIQGADDKYGTLAQIEAIERQVAGPFQKHVLAACGHSPHHEQPEATLEAMRAFIANL